MTAETCPACGEGFLYDCLEYNKVSHMGQEGEVPCFFSVCSHCGSELADARQARKNVNSVRIFKEEVEQFLKETT